MTGLQLLENYPHATAVVKAWFLEQMIESLKDETVPDDFKNFMREQGIENDKLGIMIDANPRMLFDVFDENDIFINIFQSDSGNIMWGWSDIEKTYVKDSFSKTRKEAELLAIEKAFDILENKLKPVSDDSDVTADSEDN
jgi:hypothetical protein